MNTRAIGDNIRLYCKIQNITLHALADSKWVNGHRQITAYALYRVSKVLGVTMEKLMEGIEDER